MEDDLEDDIEDDIEDDLDEDEIDEDADFDSFAHISTPDLIHLARLAGAQLLRSLGDTGPNVSYGAPVPDHPPNTTGPAP